MPYLLLLEQFNRAIWLVLIFSVTGFTVSTITGMLLEKRGQMRFVPYLFKATELFRAMLVGLITLVLLVRYLVL